MRRCVCKRVRTAKSYVLTSLKPIRTCSVFSILPYRNIHSCNQFLWQAIVGPKGFALKIHRVLEYPPRQQLYIELKDRLRRKTNFTLNMRWHSRLIPEPEGFYVDQYDGGNGVKRWAADFAFFTVQSDRSFNLCFAQCERHDVGRCGKFFFSNFRNKFSRFLAATVFRPGGARRAFPCFDEPHLRAPFHVSLFRDRFHIGLSNSIVYATEDLGFYMGVGLVSNFNWSLHIAILRFYNSIPWKKNQERASF